MPGMSGTFSLQPQFSNPDMHQGTCVSHVPWCMPGSLTSGFLWSQWWGKRSQHTRRMRNQRFCVYGKKPIVEYDRQDLARDADISRARNHLKYVTTYNMHQDHCFLVVFNIMPLINRYHLSQLPNHLSHFTGTSSVLTTNLASSRLHENVR